MTLLCSKSTPTKHVNYRSLLSALVTLRGITTVVDGTAGSGYYDAKGRPLPQEEAENIGSSVLAHEVLGESGRLLCLDADLINVRASKLFMESWPNTTIEHADVTCDLPEFFKDNSLSMSPSLLFLDPNPRKEGYILYPALESVNWKKYPECDVLIHSAASVCRSFTFPEDAIDRLYKTKPVWFISQPYGIWQFHFLYGTTHKGSEAMVKEMTGLQPLWWPEGKKLWSKLTRRPWRSSVA